MEKSKKNKIYILIVLIIAAVIFLLLSNKKEENSNFEIKNNSLHNVDLLQSQYKSL